MITWLSDVDIASQHMDMISEILRRRLPDREVWAYGYRSVWYNEYAAFSPCRTGRSWRVIGIRQISAE